MADNQRVAVCIPVQVNPRAPPFAASLQGAPVVLPNDDPEIASLVADGSLAAVTSASEG
jgi:hypothetical protein